MDVKGEYGSASSTVGGRNGRPWPLAVCQSRCEYADMAGVGLLCFVWHWREVCRRRVQAVQAVQAVGDEGWCEGSRNSTGRGFTPAWLPRHGKGTRSMGRMQAVASPQSAVNDAIAKARDRCSASGLAQRWATHRHMGTLQWTRANCTRPCRPRRLFRWASVSQRECFCFCFCFCSCSCFCFCFCSCSCFCFYFYLHLCFLLHYLGTRSPWLPSAPSSSAPTAAIFSMAVQASKMPS